MSAASSVICAVSEASSALRSSAGIARPVSSLRASSSMFVRSEVSGVRSSWPASAMSCACRSQGGGERGGHRVEGARQAGDLVLALRRDPHGEVLGVGDVLHRVGEPVDGLQPGPGHPQARRARADHPEARHQQQHPEQRGHRVLDLRQRTGHRHREDALVPRLVRADPHLHAVAGPRRVQRLLPLPARHRQVGPAAPGSGRRRGPCRWRRRHDDLHRVRAGGGRHLRLAAGHAGRDEHPLVPLVDRDVPQRRVELVREPRPHQEPARHRHRRHHHRHRRRRQQGEPRPQRQRAEPPHGTGAPGGTGSSAGGVGGHRRRRGGHSPPPRPAGRSRPRAPCARGAARRRPPSCAAGTSRTRPGSSRRARSRSPRPP